MSCPFALETRKHPWKENIHFPCLYTKTGGTTTYVLVKVYLMLSLLSRINLFDSNSVSNVNCHFFKFRSWTYLRFVTGPLG